jgi:cold shock CspA family protein
MEEENKSPKKRGKVLWYNDADENGFGFIRPEDSTPDVSDVLVCAPAIEVAPGEFPSLEEGQRVEYEIAEFEKATKILNLNENQLQEAHKWPVAIKVRRL